MDRRRWGDDALRYRADGYRLLDFPLSGVRSVQRLALRRFRRTAFADATATRAILEPAPEWATAIPAPWPTLLRPIFSDGQLMTTIAARLGFRSRQHLWAAYC